MAASSVSINVLKSHTHDASNQRVQTDPAGLKKVKAIEPRKICLKKEWSDCFFVFSRVPIPLGNVTLDVWENKGWHNFVYRLPVEADDTSVPSAADSVVAPHLAQTAHTTSASGSKEERDSVDKADDEKPVEPIKTEEALPGGSKLVVSSGEDDYEAISTKLKALCIKRDYHKLKMETLDRKIRLLSPLQH
eukprot:TRINITY_DN542_c0_g1_i1.p1 TRINITY_DN542_c0_g1~~TRINITY_DN542_c0_g1_i1.p1  ORF type:complete len:191 (+),score=39.33 TRINITY_DN542_c0_g1_i1:140-712(+)